MIARASSGEVRAPQLLGEAVKLDTKLKSLSSKQIGQLMHLSMDLAAKTHTLTTQWTDNPRAQTPALDSFVGDIYRGLDAPRLTPADRAYADDHLLILSGLYGAIRALDGITPYRLELMYALSGRGYKNLYQFWGDQVAACLPPTGPIINLASDEYLRLVTPFVEPDRIISPLFLTIMKPGDAPRFVAVHAKVARGAFANWLITSRASDTPDLTKFNALDYQYDANLSEPNRPAFVHTDQLLTGKSKLLGDPSN